MNLEFFREFGKQISALWKEIKVYQKFTVILVLCLLTLLLSFLLFQAATPSYTLLFTSKQLSIADAAEIKSYLDGRSLSYKLRGDRSILVPQEEVHLIRMDLAAAGLPKIHESKGFELFDENTWIKGEKELQILEMRALRGQLERDISAYENIKSAKVMLDIAPLRPFGHSPYKTKASVILNLMPAARVSSSQLRAISYHISGAVRGLAPNMIAISNTSGQLYQSIDPDGERDLLRSEELNLEEHIHAKVSGMLSMVVGVENFYCSVQVLMKRERSQRERKVFTGVVNGVDLGEAIPMMTTQTGSQSRENEYAELGRVGTTSEVFAGAVSEKGDRINRSESQSQETQQMAVPIDHLKMVSTPGKIEHLSIAVSIDRTILVAPESDLPEEERESGLRNAEGIEKEIYRQLKKILEGYGVQSEPAIDFVEFDHTKINLERQRESWSRKFTWGIQLGTGLFFILLAYAMFWSLNKFWKRHMDQPPELGEEEEKSSSIRDELEPSLIEVEAMVDIIKSRVQKNPTIVIETLREWFIEEQNQQKEE